MIFQMDCTPLFNNARKASRSLVTARRQDIDEVLNLVADATVNEIPVLLAENARDLAMADEADPKYDRLKLTEGRIKAIADDIRKIALLPSPLGRKLSEFRKDDGLQISRITVPFGVIGVIYEARPNVTFDVFALCIKSRNACLLKGGSDAIYSNTAIINLIKKVLVKCNIDEDVITLLPPGRDETIQLLNARGLVDLIIPRGSQRLIDYVRKNATIPVIETGAGICHIYFDESGDLVKGGKIIHNAKTRRVSVCNALDCLIINRKRLNDLPELLKLCAGSEVELFADREAFEALAGLYPGALLSKAAEETFGTEFLSKKMAVKTVGSLDEAIAHISKYGSGHSEAIISEDNESTETFLSYVDAAAVYSNASTAFTDGSQFGLGAEIGISTQKLHARGPMALEEMTTYKWIVRGNGQTRE